MNPNGTYKWQMALNWDYFHLHTQVLHPFVMYLPLYEDYQELRYQKMELFVGCND